MTGVVSPNTTPPSMRMKQAITQEAAPPPPPVEQAPPKETPETKKEESGEEKESVRIGALIKKERELYQRHKQLQVEEKRIREAQERVRDWEEAKALASKNKLEAIKKLGISYDDLTQQVLNGGNVPPEVMVQAKAEEITTQKIAELEKRLEEQARQQQKLQYDNAIKSITMEARALIDASDKFPLVKEVGAYQDITERIESEFHRTGKIIPVEQVASAMEQEIREGLEILNQRINPPKVEEPKVESPGELLRTPPQKVASTLTHKATVPLAANESMTPQQRRQRAIDAFYGRSLR